MTEVDDDGSSLEHRFEQTRWGVLSLDERRAKALLTRRLFGSAASSPLTLGRYEVHERLGSGGLGVVYRAWDPALRRQAAVKVRRIDAEGDPARGAHALLRETRRVARLTHPGVVEVFDSGIASASGVVYVVMEFLPGGTLDDWLGREARSLEAILDKFRQAAEALAAAHAVGIVHRDFKPANALLDADERVRVVDFGTHGTVGFMAPEQERGAPSDARVDVFAFCVALQRALGSRTLPSRLEEALRWGVEPSVARRCPSISALLPSLRTPTRLRWVLVGAAALGCVGLAGAVERDVPCVPPTLATGQFAARAATDRAQGYAERWNIAAAAVYCDPGAYVERDCLEALRAQWDRVTRVLTTSPDTADAVLVLDGFPAPTRCSPDRVNPSKSTALDVSFRELRLAVQSSRLLGTWADEGAALTVRVEEMRRAALVAGNARVEAGAALYLGIFAQTSGAIDVAARMYRQAHVLALRAGDPTMAFHAADKLSLAMAKFFRDPEAGQRWVERARRAASLRHDASANAELLVLEGHFASALGRFEEAIAHFDSAEAAFAEDAALVSWESLYAGRAQAKVGAGELEAGVRDFERVLEKLAELSEDSLLRAYTLQGLGGALLMLGRLDEAEAAQRRLRDLLMQQMPSTPDLASVRYNLGQVLSARRKHQDALVEFEAAYTTFEAFGGPGHPQAAAVRAAIAEQYEGLGRPEDARREAEAAIRWGAEPMYAASAHLVLARLEIEEGEFEAARARLSGVLEREGSPSQARDVAAALLRNLETPAVQSHGP